MIKGVDTCNRTACQVPLGEKRWWNTCTEAFYCQKCMLMITQYPENRHIFEDKALLYRYMPGMIERLETHHLGGPRVVAQYFPS